MRHLKEMGMTFLKGLLMGAADIVPGVSGGTIAFITDIYDRLVTGLKNLGVAAGHAARRLVGKGEEPWKAIWGRIDARLFVPLGIGIAIALGIGSYTIPAMMERYPVAVFSFFIGLIVASAWHVFGHIKEHNAKGVALAIAGMIAGLALVLIPPFGQGEAGLPAIFLLGAIAICAMILPGISGSYIMLIFGQYERILEAIHTLEWAVLLAFALGAVLGLLTFVQLLSFLLARHHASTFYVLLGLMLGALLLPVQEVRGALAGAEGVVLALAFFALGGAIVLGIDYAAKRKA